MTQEEKVKIAMVKEKYPLSKIKDIFTLRCFNSKFYSALKFVLMNLQIEWNEKLPTMAAYKREGYRVIGIGPTFVADNCRHEEDIADGLFHEMMHHVFHHLDWDKEVAKDHNLANVAGDAIINAYLHSIDSAGLFQHYYKDVVCWDGNWMPHVFLRPNSERFAVIAHGEENPLSQVDRERYYRFNGFYQKLYRLEITLEQAVAFFKEFFPEASGKDTHHGENSEGEAGDGEPQSGEEGGEEQPTQGKGDESGSEGEESDDSDAGGDGKGKGKTKKETENGKSDKPVEPTSGDDHGGEGVGNRDGQRGKTDQHEGGYDDPHEDDFLDEQTADALLHELGLKKITKKVQNNFEKIIRRITNASDRAGGSVRQGTYRSQRIPGKFGKRNALRFGLGKRQFAHGQYKMEQVALIFDHSGSMWEYIPFSQKLVEWLVRIGKDVRVAIFADYIKEFPVEEMLAGKFPYVGGGTCGEVVARYIQDEKIPEVIIVTDDYAGTLGTRITAKVHLALVEGSTGNGTFSDHAKVPKCTTYQLEKDKETQF